jgi:TM2 domain-containing membrane protein YozV
VHGIFWALIAIAFLIVGVVLGQRRYNNKVIDDSFRHLDMVISNTKREAKRKEIKFDRTQITSVLTHSN